MHLSHTIDRHKADIERRISQLQNKLKAPLARCPINMDHLQQLNSPEPYVEKKSNNVLPPSHTYENRIKAEGVENRHPHYDRNYENKVHNYVPKAQCVEKKRENYGNTSFQGEGRIAKNVQNNQALHRSSQKPVYQDEMVEMMKVIIDGQRNLQKQINQLKFQWHKDQSVRNISQQERRQPILYSRAQRRVQLPIKDSRKEHETGEIRNFRRDVPDLRNNSQPEQPKKSILKKHSPKKQILNSSDMNLQNNQNSKKPASKQKTTTKRSNKNQTLLDLATLVHNQKNRNERLVVDQQRKNEFWRLVEGRIRQSETEYRDSIHRNNKHQHEHLIYTNELQKKLKDELVSKIYSQCNSCIYK